jgi:rubrerythrin
MSFKLPSERVHSMDQHRGHTVYVDVWVCRKCNEPYDALPRVRGEVQCPACGADENYLAKRRIKD